MFHDLQTGSGFELMVNYYDNKLVDVLDMLAHKGLLNPSTSNHTRILQRTRYYQYNHKTQSHEINSREPYIHRLEYYSVETYAILPNLITSSNSNLNSISSFIILKKQKYVIPREGIEYL